MLTKLKSESEFTRNVLTLMTGTTIAQAIPIAISPILSQIDIAIEFIKKHLMVEFIITGNPQREEKYDYPLEAIREIIVNIIKPVFEEFMHGFRVILFKEKLNAPVNSLQLEILELIKKNNKISYDELAVKFDKNRTTIMRNIKKLKEQNLLKRVGSDKNGYWEALND